MILAKDMAEALVEQRRREMVAERMPEMVDRFGWDAASAAMDRVLSELAPEFDALRDSLVERIQAKARRELH